jgi:hypothetical protein
MTAAAHVHGCCHTATDYPTHTPGRSFMLNSRPGVNSDAPLGLLDHLDLEGERHFVADNHAAGFQRQVDVNTEVLAV